jgi:hypothetical protein
MDAESFFARWAKRKADSPQETKEMLEPSAADNGSTVADARLPVGSTTDRSERPLTLEDAAKLTPESDYVPFVARGVDENVKRSALKKLFSDPQFNVMDGLDTYIDDYNKFEPIPAEMLAALNHAKALLNPLSQFEKPLMQLVEEETQSIEHENENENAPACDATPDDGDAAAALTPQKDPDTLPGHSVEPISDNPVDDHSI